MKQILKPHAYKQWESLLQVLCTSEEGARPEALGSRRMKCAREARALLHLVPRAWCLEPVASKAEPLKQG